MVPPASDGGAAKTCVWMVLLSRPWALFDVDDVEALLNVVVARSGAVGRLRHHQREDLLAHLLVVAWQAANSYDPDRGRFSSLLYRAASLRTIDWVRQECGRTKWQFAGHTYERERPQPLSLDDEPALGATLAAFDGDPARGRDEGVTWLHDLGDCDLAWDYALLGIEPPPRAP